MTFSTPSFPRKRESRGGGLRAGCPYPSEGLRGHAPLVRIRIYGIIGFSEFSPARASSQVRRSSTFRLAGFSAVAKSASRAKRNPENPANPINPDSDGDARFARRVRVIPSARIFVDSARPQGYTFLASVCMASRQRGHSPVNYYLLAIDSARVWEKSPIFGLAKTCQPKPNAERSQRIPSPLTGEG